MAWRTALTSLLLLYLSYYAHGLGEVEHASSTIKKDIDSNEFVIIVSSTQKVPTLKWDTEDRSVYCKEKPSKSYSHENMFRIVKRWDCYTRFGKYLSECPSLVQTDAETPTFKLVAHADSNEQARLSCNNVQDFRYRGAYPAPNVFIIAAVIAILLILVILIVAIRRPCGRSKKGKSAAKKKKKKKAEKEKEKSKSKAKKSLLKDDFLSNGIDLDYYNNEDEFDYKPYLGGRSAKRRPDAHRRSKYSYYY